jgi:hypothetical protein
VALLLVTAAQAESPYERDQREQLERYQKQHGLSPQVQQTQRWEQEWRQQHPNEPMPNLGVLEKLHRQETINNMNQGFAKLRADRQVKLQQEHQMARQIQQRALDTQRITWSAQQWANWEKEYSRQHRQQAEDYAKTWELSGQMAREEAAREADEKRRKQGY